MLTQSTAVAAALAGFGFSLSLIIALGAQNAFVLRQGLRREHVLPVVLFCASSDAILIFFGIFGLGALLQLVPWLLGVIRWGGILFLIGYGIFALRRAFKPEVLNTDEGGSRTSLKLVMLSIAAITWLNPHVYLDTVMLMGSVATSYAENRWWFGAGAASASFAWFFTLGFGARFLRPLFAKPLSWRILDVVIALIMFALAASLAFGAM
ncbi:amino acid transporter [Gulosibacter macacae]|uniref:Amino acid transporter n=1 Tax=Gulosibacter macacae TaxID=2488791 RepID=A0A3P3VXK6_9MICO|nr:LysE/ArgO family amino acid transporter [Gulosibacter macacae]RRJ87521.1 amino acid transporter [Gulosibacter macacae]